LAREFIGRRYDDVRSAHKLQLHLGRQLQEVAVDALGVTQRKLAANPVCQGLRFGLAQVVYAQVITDDILDVQELPIDDPERADTHTGEQRSHEAADCSRPDLEDRACETVVPGIDAVLGDLSQSKLWRATRTGCGRACGASVGFSSGFSSPLSVSRNH